jgi:hypothetical protein
MALVSKPPERALDKSLPRPPFRFLQDIFYNIEEATGWCAGHFTDEDKNKEQKLDKRGKARFLTKVIQAVQATTNCTPDLREYVSPTAIAAGKECDRTNKLIQHYVKAAASGISSTDTLERMQALRDGAVVSSAAPTKQQVPMLDMEKAREPAPAATQPTPAPEPTPAPAPEPEPEPTRPVQPKAPEPEPTPVVAPVAAPVKLEEPPPLPTNANATNAPFQRLPSSANQKSGLARLKTSRRAPPRVRDANLVDEKKEVKVSAPKNVILESDIPEPDSDSEAEKEEAEAQGAMGSARGDHAQGKLMSDLMKMAGQEEAKADNGFAFKRLQSARPENRTAGLFSKQQIEILQGQIQSISASANPLGKCIEYVYEDVEQMQSELNKWRRDLQRSSTELETEKRLSKQILEPLERQLAQAILATEEQQSKISSLRADILRNELEVSKVMERKSQVTT